ncbi:unnamed protein product [Miscanthus lutarioriparius]|uniref:Uncharacterized protein n=1 Tax=Miscanthus lutarioriparius TaxID=422564 RepID=A0A811NP28_9POAL|nr:unnamed protein product [Miscanthus lutarioriparius]
MVYTALKSAPRFRDLTISSGRCRAAGDTASEKFVSFALDAACDFSTTADRSIDLAATPRVSLLTIPKPVASDCDGTAVDWLKHACEVGPSTGNLCLLTDLISPTLCRFRHSPAFLRLDPRRRCPLRCLVWRPPWRLASCGRHPRRRGHRTHARSSCPPATIASIIVDLDVVSLHGRNDAIDTEADVKGNGKMHVSVCRSNASRLDIYSRRSMGFSSTTPRPSSLTNTEIDSLEPHDVGFRYVCYSMVGRCSNFAGDAFGLSICATSGLSNYEEDAQGKVNIELGPAPLEIPLQHCTTLFRALLYEACGRTIGLMWADVWDVLCGEFPRALSAIPKPDYSAFCLDVAPSNTEDYMPANCSTVCLGTGIGVLVSTGGVSAVPPSSPKSSCLGFLTPMLAMPNASSLQDVVNTDAVEADVYAVYLKDREGVLKQVGNIPGRINLTGKPLILSGSCTKEC